MASWQLKHLIGILSITISYSFGRQSSTEVLYQNTQDSISSFTIFRAKFPLNWRDAAELCESIPGSVLAKVEKGESERMMMHLMNITQTNNPIWIRNRQTISEVLAKERNNVPTIPNVVSTIEDSYPADSEAGMTLRCSLIRPQGGIKSDLCNNYSSTAAICVQSYKTIRPFMEECPSVPNRPWLVIRRSKMTSTSIKSISLTSLMTCEETGLIIEVKCHPERGWDTTVRCPETKPKSYLHKKISNEFEKKRNGYNYFRKLPLKRRIKRSVENVDPMDLIEMLMKKFAATGNKPKGNKKNKIKEKMIMPTYSVASVTVKNNNTLNNIPDSTASPNNIPSSNTVKNIQNTSMINNMERTTMSSNNTQDSNSTKNIPNDITIDNIQLTTDSSNIQSGSTMNSIRNISIIDNTLPTTTSNSIQNTNTVKNVGNANKINDIQIKSTMNSIDNSSTINNIQHTTASSNTIQNTSTVNNFSNLNTRNNEQETTLSSSNVESITTMNTFQNSSALSNIQSSSTMNNVLNLTTLMDIQITTASPKDIQSTSKTDNIISENIMNNIPRTFSNIPSTGTTDNIQTTSKLNNIESTLSSMLITNTMHNIEGIRTTNNIQSITTANNIDITHSNIVTDKGTTDNDIPTTDIMNSQDSIEPLDTKNIIENEIVVDDNDYENFPVLSFGLPNYDDPPILEEAAPKPKFPVQDQISLLADEIVDFINYNNRDEVRESYNPELYTQESTFDEQSFSDSTTENSIINALNVPTADPDNNHQPMSKNEDIFKQDNELLKNASNSSLIEMGEGIQIHFDPIEMEESKIVTQTIETSTILSNKNDLKPTMTITNETDISKLKNRSIFFPKDINKSSLRPDKDISNSLDNILKTRNKMNDSVNSDSRDEDLIELKSDTLVPTDTSSILNKNILKQSTDSATDHFLEVTDKTDQETFIERDSNAIVGLNLASEEKFNELTDDNQTMINDEILSSMSTISTENSVTNDFKTVNVITQKNEMTTNSIETTKTTNMEEQPKLIEREPDNDSRKDLAARRKDDEKSYFVDFVLGKLFG